MQRHGWVMPILASCLAAMPACGDGSSTGLELTGGGCDVELSLVDELLVAGPSSTPLSVPLRVDARPRGDQSCRLELDVDTVPAGRAQVETERLVFDRAEPQTVTIAVHRTELGPIDVAFMVTEAGSEDDAGERIEFRVDVESGSYELGPAPAEVQLLPVDCERFVPAGMLANQGRVPLVVTASLTSASGHARPIASSRAAPLRVAPGESIMTGLWVTSLGIIGPTPIELSLTLSPPEATAAARRIESRTVAVEFEALVTWAPNAEAEAWNFISVVRPGVLYASLRAPRDRDVVVDRRRLEVRRNGLLLPRGDPRDWQPGEWALWGFPDEASLEVRYFLPPEARASREVARAHMEGFTMSAPASGCPE